MLYFAGQPYDPRRARDGDVTCSTIPLEGKLVLESSEAAGELALLLALVVMAGFFAGAEVAFLRVQRSWVRQAEESGSRLARILSALQERREIVIATLLVGITGSYYVAEHIATVLGTELLGPTVGPFVALVVITVLVLVFAEATPMMFAARNPERVALLSSPVVALSAIILLPVVGLLALVAKVLLFIVGIRPNTILPSVTEEQLKAMIEEGQSQGTLPAGTGRMLHGALDFGDQTTGQVMTPRPDIIGIEQDATIAEALEVAASNKQTRLPTYLGDRDTITGILYVKDLLPYVRLGEMATPVKTVARAATYVPESLPIDRLLERMRADRRTMVIVSDEYGGTAGLVTMEDLLEEIVGEIEDEYDVGQPEITRIDENCLMCDASIGLHELANLVGGELPTDEFDSLGGIVLEAAGRIPTQGETYEWGGLELTVEEMDGLRISRVLVSQPPVAEGDGDGVGGRT